MSSSSSPKRQQHSSWSLSVTAPGFGPKQEHDEWAGLPPEEKTEIINELYGLDYDVNRQRFERQEQNMLELVDRVQDHITSNIADEDKKEYLEAFERAPEIVQKETDPAMFLRCENYDIELAAKRLVTHWKHRISLFGEEKAFEPMTIRGALRDDREMLEAGFVVQHADDVHERPVLFLDRVGSTLSSLYDRDSWLRVMWYFFQTLCESPEYQRRGYVLLINLKDYIPHKCNDRIGAKKMFVYVRECWCPRMKGYHATYASHQTPVKLVEPAIRQMQGKHIRTHLVNHYGFDSENLKALRDYGLLKEHLSHVIGGDFTHDDHLEWLRKREQIELQRAATDA